MAIVDLRYARALAAVVDQQKLDCNAVQAQLQDFASTLKETPALREVLGNPSIPEAQKLGVLDGLASRLGVDRAVRNFLAVVMHHGRLHEFGEMVDSYHALADAETHVAEAEITTARPLDDASRQVLEQQVARLAGGDTVRATYLTDPSLLGGAVVKLGSTVYDGSIRAQLEQMRQRLTAAN